MELNSFYKTELPPKEIFNSMRENIFDFSTNQIPINSRYLNLRSQLLNILRQISSKMCFKSQTYFLSIYYLDILSSNNKNKKYDLNYNVMALACLLLSAKNCENDPIVPSLKYFTKIYNKIIGNKSIISVSDLFYAEVMAIKLLNHKLNYYTIYDFNSFFFGHNLLTEEQLKTIDNNFDINNNKYIFNGNNKYLIKDKGSVKVKKVYEKIYRLARYYLDIIIENQLCIKYSSLLLSIFILKKSIQIILLHDKYNNHNIDYISKERFIIKNNNYFNRIIKGYYKFDYEKDPEYQKLINEPDIKQLFNDFNNDEYNPNYYNIKSNKTLTSFNTKENLHKVKDDDNKMNKNNKNLVKVKDINQAISKYNFNKLKSTNNTNTKIKNMNSSENFSGQNLPSINNKTVIQNKDKENTVMNQNNLYRNVGKDNGLHEKYFTKENKNNINIKDYFSEKKNNMKIPEINTFSPSNKINSGKYIMNLIKRTKSKEKEKIDNFFLNLHEINNMEDIGRLTLVSNKNKNQIANNNKPYYKKVVQKFNSKLNNRNIIQYQISNKYNFDNENINKNQVLKNNYNHYASNKLNNKQISKYELNTETKHNKNKRFNYNDFNAKNLDKDLKEKASFSNNKDRKISKLFHINLNHKLIDSNSPLDSLYVNKKINGDIFSSTSYINKNKSYKSKFENRTSKSINNFESLMNNKRNNNRYKDVKSNYFEQARENKLKNYLYDSDEFNENNLFSNKLTNSSKVIGMQLTMKSIKDKNKDKISKNKNKIYLTENNFSGDENANKLNSEININDYIKAKKIEVKKNKFDNEIKNRIKKSKNNNLLNYHEYMSNNPDDNLYKKNSSTIVINNNININFGNKSINGYRDIKKYGQNSISSLLHKIPLSYKSSEIE